MVKVCFGKTNTTQKRLTKLPGFNCQSCGFEHGFPAWLSSLKVTGLKMSTKLDVMAKMQVLPFSLMWVVTGALKKTQKPCGVKLKQRQPDIVLQLLVS